MWRLRTLIILAALIGALVYGAAVANGAWWWNAWWWNAETSGQGVDLRTAWTVMPDGSNEAVDGDESNYHATIELRVPQSSSFTLVGQADAETVVLNHVAYLECKVDGIEAEVYYYVEPLAGALGDLVKARVLVDGQVVDDVTGHLEETLKMQFLVPADEPECFSP